MAESEDVHTEQLPLYCLHVFPFSLYSMMARFTYVLARSTESHAGSKIQLENKLVNLHHDEHVTEEYLLHINPKGQVRRLLATRDCVLTLIGPGPHWTKS